MLRVRVQWTGIPGSPYLSTFYFGGASSADAQEAADAVRAFLVAVGITRRSDLTGQVINEVDVVEPLTGAVTGVRSVTSAPFTGGGNASAALPVATQGLLRLRTGTFVGGREIRGRIFLPGYTEEVSDSGRPTAGWVADIDGNALGTLFGTELSNQLSVYSPTRRQVAAVTTASAWNQWAVLRSRRD